MSDKKSVMAVDDSETMRMMMQQTLEMGEYDIVLAEDGVDALEKFKKKPVDLIITDVNMPVMDGITFIREVRKLNANVPILTLTTETEEELKRQGADAGANGWVVKPLRPAQMLDLISQILE